MARMSSFIISCILLLGLFGNSASQVGDFANQLRNCDSPDAAVLNKCLENVLRGLKKFLPTGIPDLNVPSLEPIKLGSFNFSQNGGQVNIDAQFSDVDVFEFSKFELRSVKVDLKQYTLAVDVYIPKLLVKGIYKTKGTVLFLDIGGNGAMRAILRNITAQMISNIIKKPGSDINGERLGLSNTKLHFELEQTIVRLQNLFDDPLLQRTVDHFIATNSDLIINEIRPGVSRDIAAFVESVMDAALAEIPVDVVYNN